MAERITSDDLLALHDAVAEKVKQLREQAETQGSAGSWGAWRCLNDSLYDIFGAVGWMAKDEGKLDGLEL